MGGLDFVKDALKDVEEFGKDIVEHPLETIATVIAAPIVLGAAAAGIGAVGGSAAVVAPAVTAGLSAKEQYDASKLALEIGEKNAAAAAAQTAEQIRVVTEENERTEATARARAAASGLSGASSEIYIEALSESGRADIDWLKQVGESTYQSALDRGESAYHSAQAAMWGSIGGVASGTTGAVTTIAGFL